MGKAENGFRIEKFYLMKAMCFLCWNFVSNHWQDSDGFFLEYYLKFSVFVFRLPKLSDLEWFKKFRGNF